LSPLNDFFRFLGRPHLQDVHDEEVRVWESTKQELERSRQDLAKAQADAAHAAELAEEAGRDLMRQELGRLTDQIAELKAALYTRLSLQVPVPVDSQRSSDPYPSEALGLPPLNYPFSESNY
jgi:hypothetical protein